MREGYRPPLLGGVIMRRTRLYGESARQGYDKDHPNINSIVAGLVNMNAGFAAC